MTQSALHVSPANLQSAKRLMTRRVLFRVATRTAIFMGAITLGMVAGTLLGVRVALNFMQHSLRSYAVDRLGEVDDYSAEALRVLAKMNASSLPRCSEAELGSFRRLLMNDTHYLKDIGRMSGGRLECSAMIDRSSLPEYEFQPAFDGSDNSKIYINVEPLRVGPWTAIVMRIQDSYVAFDPYPRKAGPPGRVFTITMRTAPAGRSPYLGGDRFPVTKDLLKENVDRRDANNLYSTQCSDHYPPCVTASMNIHTAILEQSRQVRVWVIIGGLSGLCLGLVYMLLIKQEKGIERQLRRAIRQHRLRVVYQPLVDLVSMKVVGAEALVRWTDEDGLVISPQVFIQIAEQRGFVNLITAWVVRQVIADFGPCFHRNKDFFINVNVAASDLSDKALLPMLDASLRAAGASPRNLVIEITEGATVRHRVGMEAVAQLRGRGYRVFIDDFGTGYSSLAYLKDLTVDGIKIDKAFTQTIGTDSVTVGILPQILAMGEVLKLTVVAEGIETQAQCAYYRARGLPYLAQGWLFGHAVTLEEFHDRWLVSDKPLINTCSVGETTVR